MCDVYVHCIIAMSFVFEKMQIILQTSVKLLFNPLSPHDALKHHFTSLKTDLIFLQLGVL